MMRDLRVLLFGAVLMVVGCTPTEEPVDDGDSDTATGSDIDPDQQINFPDPVLRTCVEKLIYGKNPGDPIYAKEVANITKVDCDGVGDITGIEYFVSIKTISFYNSQINNIDGIAKLYNVSALIIRGGEIENLNAIKNLSKLETININAALKDISALEDKQYLTSAFFASNKIENASAFSRLSSIQMIELQNNPTLTTLGAQFTAPKLTNINVGSCGLTSLNELSGLPELTSITAGDNYLTDISFITTLPKLGAIGIGGNCLPESEVQEFVDWWNAKNPEYPKTLEEVMQWQTPEKCQ